MIYLQFLYDHAGAIGGWLVAAYHVIANAGGLTKIWQNFYGKPISPIDPPTLTNPDAPCLRTAPASERESGSLSTNKTTT